MGTIQLEQLIDVGFVLLVTLVAWKALFSSPTAAVEQKATLWQQKLRELEEHLQELISEAKRSTYHLDKHLLHRKEELNDLLKELSNVSRSSEPVHELSENDIIKEGNIINEGNIVSDLPNDSWLQPLQREQVDDKPNETVPPVALTEQIEIDADSKQNNELETLVRENATSDDTRAAYRVAYRLLSRGQTPHAVARKVNLSIDEVRLVDQTIREAPRQSEPYTYALATEEIIR